MTLTRKKGNIVTKVVHIFTNLITPSAKEMSARARVDEDEPVGASVSGAARSLAGRRSVGLGLGLPVVWKSAPAGADGLWRDPEPEA